MRRSRGRRKTITRDAISKSEAISMVKFLPFEEAREYIRGLIQPATFQELGAGIGRAKN
jgi:hypothetical protein